MMSSMLQHRKLFPAILAIALLGTAALANQASAAVTGLSSPAAASGNFPARVFYQQFNQPLKPPHVEHLPGSPDLLHRLYVGQVARAVQGRRPAYPHLSRPGVRQQWVSGGVSMARILNQTYGRWVVRFRMRRGTGVGMDVALRPSGSGTVVDWIEESSDHGALRNLETATLHYGNTRVHAHVMANFTKWHTMTLSWIPEPHHGQDQREDLG